MSGRATEKFINRYRRFLRDGVPSRNDQKVLRNAFAESRGAALDYAASLARRRYPVPNYPLEPTRAGVLHLSEDQFRDAQSSLSRNGWWIAPTVLSDSLIQAFQSEAVLQLESELGLEPGSFFDEGRQWPKEMHFLNQNWVLQQELFSLLIESEDIRRVAGNYLGVDPVLSQAASWFSFPVTKIQDGSAQNWHWDCDRVRWLKMFVYISDVEQENGPHAFVQGSHRDLRLDSVSSRYTNDEVLQEYSEDDVVEFVGQRGTVIFEDTRGLHKGSPLVKGWRLVLQLEFTIDLFGYTHSGFHLPANLSTFARSHKRLMQGFSAA